VVEVTTKIVLIGGGSGISNLLLGLKRLPVEVSAIVSTMDSGGSSGKLRKELGVLPPGDLRQCVLALATRKKLASLLSHRIGGDGNRFSGDGVSGHSLGNLVLIALSDLNGGLEKGLNEFGKLVGARGKVIPVTLEKAELFVEFEDGRKLSENELNPEVFGSGKHSKVKKAFLSNPVRASESALREIAEADAIVLGPGDLYSSTIANLLVDGIPEAIRNSNARKIFVCSLMTRPQETQGFKASDYARELEKYLGSRVDCNIVNDKKPGKTALAAYSKEGAFPVEFDEGELQKLVSRVVSGNFLKSTKLVRHDPVKTSKAIVNLALEK
jgi:uncharacterized cofD-like protein